MSRHPIRALARVLDRERIPSALIGGHAVDTLLEPRLTRDIDVTVVADAQAIERLGAALEADGFVLERRVGAEPSGPDFVRFVRAPVVIEIQTAKTRLQHSVVARAASADGVRIATPEDLIVLKLIAYPPEDRADLAGLAALPGIDWGYVERWADEWGVADRLVQVRGG